MNAGGDRADAVASGVTLAQYAAVTAALAESYPLKAVLAVEGIDPIQWTDADQQWTERLANDASLLAAYEAHLAAASERLGRTVEPIDSDLGAWLAFLAALGKKSDPAALLDKHGLGPSDVERLRRRWDARMRVDPALERRAVELRALGLPALPALRVVKPKLTKWTGADVLVVPVAAPAPREVAVAAHVDRADPIGVIGSEEPPRGYAGIVVEDSVTVVAVDLHDAPLPFRASPSAEFLEAMARPSAAPGDGSDGATMAFEVPAALRASLPRIGMDPEDEPDDPTRTMTAIVTPAAKPLPFEAPPRETAARAHPVLSLEQHASLCVELAVDPAHTAEALARYQVSLAEKARADEYYRARLGAEPELRVQWNRAFEIYRAWFLSQPRS